MKWEQNVNTYPYQELLPTIIYVIFNTLTNMSKNVNL